MSGTFGLLMALLPWMGQAEGPANDRVALCESLAASLDPVPATGLLIFGVTADSQASAAGLAVGDIITHYDGQPCPDHQTLSVLARDANNQKRPTILVLARRQGQELEFTLSPGPIGVRLEDVAEGERRPLPDFSAPNRWEPDLKQVGQWIDARRHHWMMVVDSKDSDQPIGFQHRFWSTDDAGQPICRLQQTLSIGERTIRQDVLIGFRLDPVLSMTSLRLSIDERVILDALREGANFVGTRTGVPIRVPATDDAISSYLLPPLLSTLNESKPVQWIGSYLPPASLEASPLAEITAGPGKPITLRSFGREEVRVTREDNGSWRADLRGGITLRETSAEEIAAHFPVPADGFTPIEQLPVRVAQPVPASPDALR